ncbi:MAG: hypothetical protein IPO31_21895 [Candidatus Obscuribacter sp.]|nr:hypothetical protein [Candidatus Obscuribacter sp.]
MEIPVRAKMPFKRPFLTRMMQGNRGREEDLTLFFMQKRPALCDFEMFDENMEALQVLDQAIRALMPFIKTQQESDGIYSVRLPLFYEKACILRKTGANEDALKCLDTAIEGYRGVLQRSHHLKQQDLDWEECVWLIPTLRKLRPR